MVESRLKSKFALFGTFFLVLVFAYALARPAYAVQAEAELAADSGTVAVASAAAIADGVYNMVPLSAKTDSLAVQGLKAKAGSNAVLATTQQRDWLQKWIVVRDAKTGNYVVRNLATRMVLGVAGTAKAGRLVKAVKQTSVKAQVARQTWTLQKSKGAYVLRLVANPKLVLTVVAAKTEKGSPTLRLAKVAATSTALNPTRAQKFKLSAVDAIDDGSSYFIRSGSAGKVLGVTGDSRKANAKIVLEKYKNARNEKFRLLKVGKVTYRMQGASSCLYVGAKGTSLRQFAKVTGMAKKWLVQLDMKTGTFTITSKSTNKRLDATNGKLALRTQATTSAKLKAQRFIFVPTAGFKLYLDPGHNWYNSIFDPGAQGNGYDEADLTRDLANRIANQLVGTDVEVVNGGKFHLDYWRRNAKAASLGCDLVLSVHFDAGGGNTTATMIGTSGPLSRSKAFNKIVHKALVSSTGLRDGGTMVRSDITIVNGSVPSVLMEVCFIDNYSCLKKYLSRRNTIATSLAQAVVTASRTGAIQK